MKFRVLLMAIGLAASLAGAQTANFDSTYSGALPGGFLAGITGPGEARWALAPDPSAPNGRRVIQQSAQVASHSYPWCVCTNIIITNGYVETRFKPVSGKEDQAGGVIWRWQDGDNYYVARGNVLEDNIILFRTEHGKRKELRRVPMKVAPSQWHLLRVDFSGNHFAVSFDGQKVMDWEDDTFQKAGAVGLWTKADSVTLFDGIRSQGN